MREDQIKAFDNDLSNLMAKYGVPAAAFLGFFTESGQARCISLKLNAAGDNNPFLEAACKKLARIAFDGAMGAVTKVPGSYIISQSTDFGNGVRQGDPDKN